jgi:hypothetical protein
VFAIYRKINGPLQERFDGWNILESRYQTAPESTRKDFSTIIAEKPSQKN